MRIINLTGIVGTDATQKLTQGGSEYISFRFVNNEPTDEKDAEGKSKGFWTNVVSYNPIHKKILQYLVKGKPLLVIGTLDENIYTSKISGQCEIGRTIRASHIEFLNTGQHRQEDTSSTSPQTSVNSPTTTETEMPTVTGTTIKSNNEVNNPYSSSSTPKPVGNTDDDDTDDLPF